MNTLKEKAENNLKYILEMGENDTFISERGKLVPQNDFVQVNNVVDLEYAIYFTFHQYLLSDNINKIYNHKLIQKLDTVSFFILSEKIISPSLLLHRGLF